MPGAKQNAPLTSGRIQTYDTVIALPEPSPISLFVKLGYWDVYRSTVMQTARGLRKVLYIWGFVAVLWLGLSTILVFHPAPEKDWAVTMQNASPLKWAFAIPFILVFGLPLLSARRVLSDERVKRGVTYQFSDTGIRVETSVSKSDLSWAAILRVSETRYAFLLFTNPNIATILPKGRFESHDTVDALRELFRAHVPNTNLRNV
jgi:YcxB-like protein